ncbi:MAG: hypothetical protein ACLRN1_06975, partial [Streptococcus xiaochunlingii]
LSARVQIRTHALPFCVYFFEKLSAHVYIATQTLAFWIHHRGQASKVRFIPAPTSLVPYMLS